MGVQIEIVKTDEAAAAIGPYSQAIVVGEFVFSSGQLPVNPKTGEVITGNITSQTEQVLKNIHAVLEAAGSNLESIVKTTCYLADMSDFAKFNEVYGKNITGKPARSCVAVRQLPKNALIEIDVIALTAD
ncbi:MAG: RidA family protein [Clostridiaceae bacterium]|jgi:2-iminobutanoate/2-iminopropanoate deaminase|nr:RidA family protein [Clostridiaceae bacterium]